MDTFGSLSFTNLGTLFVSATRFFVDMRAPRFTGFVNDLKTRYISI